MKLIKLNKFLLLIIITNIINFISGLVKSKKDKYNKKKKTFSIICAIILIGNIILELECDFKPIDDDEADVI